MCEFRSLGILKQVLCKQLLATSSRRAGASFPSSARIHRTLRGVSFNVHVPNRAFSLVHKPSFRPRPRPYGAHSNRMHTPTPTCTKCFHMYQPLRLCQSPKLQKTLRAGPRRKQLNEPGVCLGSATCADTIGCAMSNFAVDQ